VEAENLLNSYIDEKRVVDSDARYLTQVSEFFSVELTELITNLSPSTNALKSLLVLIEEISKKESISMSEVYSSLTLSETVNSVDIPRKDKIKRIREVLEKRRYPERSRLEDLVKKNLVSASKNYNLKVSLPEEFEGDRLIVKISGRSPEDFKLAAKKLLEFSDSEELGNLYSILRGEL
jgi:hypothetical protein